MTNTARLGLQRPVGTDLISGGDDVITANANVLDNAAMYAQGTFAARPAASALNGKLYLATDVSILYLSDGTNWFEVSRGAASIPLGSSIEYAGAGDPADTRFILEDGRAISRATYSALFALIGTTYGAGDGVNTFNIPDSRGRVTVGPDNMGTGQGAAGRLASNNTRGAVGGTETVALAIGNLPAHTHGVGTLVNANAGSHDHTAGTLATASNGDHTHGVGTFSIGGSGTLTSNDQSADHTHTGYSSTVGDHAHGAGPWARTDSLGGGGPLWGTAGSSSTAGSGTSGAGTHSHGIQTYGASNGHTHTINSHGHSLTGATATAGAHTHTISGNVAFNGDHTHAISGATASAGSGTAVANMPPYVVKNKIIRVL